MDKVLVACPTYSGKDYALESYLRAYNSFDYPQKHLFMVDNSHDGYTEKLTRLGVDHVHLDIYGDTQYLVDCSWVEILKKISDYDYVFSCESDNINPPDTIDTLLEIAKRYGAYVVAHEYPNGTNDWVLALGCTMIDVRLLREIANPKHFESQIFQKCREMGKPFIQLSGVLKTEHLKI